MTTPSTPERPIEPNRLREIREARGLLQVEVSDMTGYAQATVSRHESGERPVSRSARHAYSKLYGVPVDELFPDHPALDLKLREPVLSR